MSFHDADLIARALSLEDQNAFSELVRRHQSPVRAFLTKMTRGDTHLADDLAQETFLKAWRKLSTFRGDARFSTWLFGIAYNEFRAAARRRKELALEDIESPPPEAAQPAADTNSRLRLDLTEALKLLSSAERAAIVLCCQNGLTHEEAAQVLNCPLGTVKTNVLRGREKLRRHLALEYRHIMHPPENQDPLDALLQREHDTYLEDRGFTTRVIGALPPRRRPWLRPVILFSAIMVSSAILLWRLPDLIATFNALQTGGPSPNYQALLPLAALLAVAASLGWSLFAAVNSED